MSLKAPLNKIKPNPYQPEGRLKVDETTADKFGRSILEHGLIMTPVARKVPWRNLTINGDDGFYEMGDGWLRYSGLKWLVELPSEKFSLLKDEIQKRLKESGSDREIPSQDYFKEIPLDVRELTNQQMADMVLEANGVRQDMTPIDKAKFYKKYFEDFPDITQKQFAAAHGMSQGEVANIIRLLELPAPIQEDVISQKISETAARQLLRLKVTPELQQEVAAQAIKNNMTVNELDQAINRELWHKSKSLEQRDYSFDVKTCTECQKIVLAQDPYGSSKKEKRCTDLDCWDKKQKAFEEAQIAKIQAEKGEGGSGEKIYTDKDLASNQFEPLADHIIKQLDNPKECETCAKRALYRYSFHSSDSEPIPICLNPSCLRSKKSKKTRDSHAKEKKQDQELTAELGVSFKKLSGVKASRNCLAAVARNLLQELSADGKADMLTYFPTLPTVKGRLNVEAAQLVCTSPIWNLDDLIQFCSAAIITKHRRQYSGQYSPKLQDSAKKDYAILTGDLASYEKEVRDFQRSNCEGCDRSIPERVGTGENCCQTPYWKRLNDEGKCDGRVSKENPAKCNTVEITQEDIEDIAYENDGLCPNCGEDLEKTSTKNQYYCSNCESHWFLWSDNKIRIKPENITTEYQSKEITEEITGIPCEDCANDGVSCGRERFHVVDGKEGYFCESKVLRSDQKHTYDVRCHKCHEFVLIPFAFDSSVPADNKMHWEGPCPKCQAENFISKSSWDKEIEKSSAEPPSPEPAANKEGFETKIIVKQDFLQQIAETRSCEDSYIPKGKIKKPFTYENKLYISIGGSGRGFIEYEQHCYLLTPKSEYKGTIRKYNDPLRPRGSYDGIVVKFKNVEYVLTGPEVRFIDPDADRLWQEKYPNLALPEGVKPSCYKAFFFCVYPDCKTKCPRGSVDLSLLDNAINKTLFDFKDLTSKISQKKGEPTVLMCAGKKGEGEDLKEATLALCRELGIKYDSPANLVEVLKKFPQSANRDLLLSVLEPEKVKVS